MLADNLLERLGPLCTLLEHPGPPMHPPGMKDLIFSLNAVLPEPDGPANPTWGTRRGVEKTHQISRSAQKRVLIMSITYDFLF